MYFDRFDIVNAYYHYFKDYHTGISSNEYLRLSKIKSYYRPNHREGSEMTDNARAIYNRLVETN